MLVQAEICAFLSTTNPANAKVFFSEKLGLKLQSEDSFALEYEIDGTVLRITTVNDLSPQPFTVFGFRIVNITDQVKALSAKGVVFEIFPALDQDDSGIWASPSGAQIAWFKDPDGNILSLTEIAA